MDPELIDPDLVFAKTASGEQAMLQRTRVVQRNIRMVLILVDGNATVAELCHKTGNPQLTQNALLELENDGFIERRAEMDSVWGREGSFSKAARTVASQVVSEFSTFGTKSTPTTEKLSSSAGEPRRIIPFPENREGRASPPRPTAAPTPEPSVTGPESGTVFLPRDIVTPELPAAASVEPPELTPSLLARLKRLVARGTMDGQPEIKPIRRGVNNLALTWPMGVMVGVLLFGSICILVALLFPYAHYLPAVEAAIEQSTGQPAKVNEMRVSFYPKPALLLGQVRLGGGSEAEQIRIAEIRLQPVVGTLLSSKIRFREAGLSELVLSTQAIASISRMLEAAARASAGADALHVFVENAEVSLAGLVVDDMRGEFELSDNGLLQSVSLRSNDRNLQLQLKPAANGLTVQLEGLAWRSSKRSPYFFDSLNVKGATNGAAFVIDTAEVRIFDGVVRGTGVLRADPRPTMDGEISFERINSRKLGEALGIGGQFEGDATGKLRFLATGDTWRAALAALNASGNLTIHRGTLGGIDLPEAVRRVSTTPATLGGGTRFEDLTGAITVTPNVYRFSRLALNAGLMQSTGQIEVNRDLQLRGRMDVQMRGRADHTATPVAISGPLKAPLLQAVTR